MSCSLLAFGRRVWLLDLAHSIHGITKQNCLADDPTHGTLLVMRLRKSAVCNGTFWTQLSLSRTGAAPSLYYNSEIFLYHAFQFYCLVYFLIRDGFCYIPSLFRPREKWQVEWLPLMATESRKFQFSRSLLPSSLTSTSWTNASKEDYMSAMFERWICSCLLEKAISDGFHFYCPPNVSW